MTEKPKPNPFATPGFIAVMGVIALVAVLGLALALMSVTRSYSVAPFSQTASESPAGVVATTNPASNSLPLAANQASICGLKGEVLSGSITRLPEADWEYQGTTAYPLSAIFGPATTSPEGYRYCFQHSPEGALFAAANAAVQGSEKTIAATWSGYVVAEGPYREELVADMTGGPVSGAAGSRMRIEGYRLLDYDWETARVDLGMLGTSDGKSTYTSVVYDLVWVEGDWKISANKPTPVDIVSVPDLAGYTAWAE